MAGEPAGSGALAFDSVLGPCLIAWTGRGVVAFHVADPADRLRRGAVAPGRPAGSAPAAGSGSGPPVTLPIVTRRRAPPWIRQVVRRIEGHLAGELDDLLDVPLDLPEDATDFDRAIWDTTREVAPGLTATYGEVAAEAGHPAAARAAGSALRRCPIPLLIPAHRVIAAGRRPGGWTGAGGVSTKLRLLAVEGVVLPGYAVGASSG